MKGSALERFCKLSQDHYYLPCQWNFAYDDEARTHFIDFFRGQFDRSLMLGRAQAEHAGLDLKQVDAKVESCRHKFNACLDEMLEHPERFDRPTILTVDYIRDAILRDAGFHDPYYEIKHHDNELVIGLLSEICRDLDEQREPFRLQSAIRGAMAGNIFDMGVAATAKRMMEKSLSFLHTRDNLPHRPWLVDDLDALTRRILYGPVHHKAVMFVDNAGADFILGMLPLARYFAQRGTEVIVVGNELPSLNDMTLKDMQEIWGEIIAAEPSFDRLPIKLASSGTGEPLIDLSAISTELNRLAADADLVIVEGMGRALESNFFTRFSCDAIKLAMVKDDFVARRYDGQLYDVICRFEPAPR